MTDREIITDYRDIVRDYHSTMLHLAWNIRHRLPALSMPAQLEELKAALLRFDDILDTIPDRRTRNILRGRYALGLTISDVAIGMGLSRATVQRICDSALAGMR